MFAVFCYVANSYWYSKFYVLKKAKTLTRNLNTQQKGIKRKPSRNFVQLTNSKPSSKMKQFIQKRVLCIIRCLQNSSHLRKNIMTPLYRQDSEHPRLQNHYEETTYLNQKLRILQIKIEVEEMVSNFVQSAEALQCKDCLL